MSNLLSIILVAVLGVIGNIAYFEYQTRQKNSKELLKQRLTDLLLPLYVILHVEEIAMRAWYSSPDGDYAGGHSELPTRVLLPINDIIKKNIYLADEELHQACLNFLQWAYHSDENERFQSLMGGKFDASISDKGFNEFQELVTRKYHEARMAYSYK
jgi:hypothetical protein